MKNIISEKLIKIANDVGKESLVQQIRRLNRKNKPVRLHLNLQGANLSGADLSEANLGGANLEGSYLQGANLEGAHLEGANIKGTILEKK